MSYYSRLYNHRNAQTHDDVQKKPFFQKKQDPNKSGQSDFTAAAQAVVQRKKLTAVQRLASPAEEEKQSTNDQRMEQDKERNIHRAQGTTEADKDLKKDDLSSTTASK